jgi:hypothetical protein
MVLKRQLKIYSILQLAFIILTGVRGHAIQNPTASPSNIVRQYLSSDNLESAISYLAPDYKLRFDTRPEGGMNRKQVVRMLEWDFALNPQHRIADMQVNGLQVVVRFHEDNDFSLLIGHPGWDAVSTFTVSESGLITSQLFMPEQGQADWKINLEEALPWLRQNHSDILAKIYPNSRLIQRAETAREWTRILRDWRAATGKSDPTKK